MRLLPALLSVFLGAAASVATAADTPTATASPPRAIASPAPAYDDAERRAGHAGQVQIVFRVAADGTVTDARVAQSSGWPVLDASALESARGWRFEPARDGAGKAVASQVQMPIAFPAAPEDPVAQARATTCARFLTEVSAYRLGGSDPLGGGHFGIVWGALMQEYKAKYGQAAAMAKMPLAKRVFDNTVASCRRAPSRPLGAAVEGEFYQIR
jgi:protein TonB